MAISTVSATRVIKAHSQPGVVTNFSRGDVKVAETAIYSGNGRFLSETTISSSHGKMSKLVLI